MTIDIHAEEAKTSFTGVFIEICKTDYYGLREIPFIPDTVLDVGANVGAFTSYARFLFPEAKIVAIEPDVVNFAELMNFTAHLPGVTHLRAALATGPVWQGLSDSESPYYRMMQSYVTAGQIGFPEKEMRSPPGTPGRDDLPVYEECLHVLPKTLDELVADYVEPQDKLLLKLDCEGGENCIFSHEPSMKALRRVDFLTMETHYYTKGTGTEFQANRETLEEALMSLSDTHDCTLNRKTRCFKAVKRVNHV